MQNFKDFWDYLEEMQFVCNMEIKHLCVIFWHWTLYICWVSICKEWLYFFKKLCLYLLIIVLYIHLSLEIELSEEISTFRKTFSKRGLIVHKSFFVYSSIYQGDQLIMTLSSVKSLSTKWNYTSRQSASWSNAVRRWAVKNPVAPSVKSHFRPSFLFPCCCLNSECQFLSLLLPVSLSPLVYITVPQWSPTNTTPTPISLNNTGHPPQLFLNCNRLGFEKKLFFLHPGLTMELSHDE